MREQTAVKLQKPAKRKLAMRGATGRPATQARFASLVLPVTAQTFTRTAIAARPAAVPLAPARAEQGMEKDTGEKERDALAAEEGIESDQHESHELLETEAEAEEEPASGMLEIEAEKNIVEVNTTTTEGTGTIR